MVTVERGFNPAVCRRDCRCRSLAEKRLLGDNASSVNFRRLGGLSAVQNGALTAWFDDEEAEVLEDLGGVGYDG